MEPTMISIKEAAANTAKLWHGDWKIYHEEVQKLTGLTLEQSILFDMMVTWRAIHEATQANMAKLTKHWEDEHGEDWQTGG